MNILITGRSGFIARHLIDAIQNSGNCVIGSYNASDAFCGNGKIDAVIHLAAQAGIRPEQQKAIPQYEANVMQTISFLDLSIKYNVKKFIFISSSSVYGTPEHTPVSEDDVTDRPLCHYAATKKAGELACHTYHYLYGLDVAVLRPFTVYGPGQTSRMAIPTFTHLIDKGQEVIVYGNGSIKRDYVYVKDVADGIIKALDVSHGYSEYNIGSGMPLSTIDLIKTIEDKLGKKARIKFIPLPEGEAQDNYSNINKAKSKFGYSPKFPFDEGISNYINWYRKEGR
jgi:UDP-glucuronate 4-epimerase